MRGTLKLMSLRLINEKTPLFSLCSSSPPARRRAGLWVFVPLWLNRYLDFNKNCHESDKKCPQQAKECQTGRVVEVYS